MSERSGGSSKEVVLEADRKHRNDGDDKEPDTTTIQHHEMKYIKSPTKEHCDHQRAGVRGHLGAKSR